MAGLATAVPRNFRAERHVQKMEARLRDIWARLATQPDVFRTVDELARYFGAVYEVLHTFNNDLSPAQKQQLASYLMPALAWIVLDQVGIQLPYADENSHSPFRRLVSGGEATDRTVSALGRFAQNYPELLRGQNGRLNGVMQTFGASSKAHENSNFAGMERMGNLFGRIYAGKL